MQRRLALTRERLTELTTSEMEALAGAALPTQNCTGYYMTINARCPSINDCIAIGAIPSVNSPCPTLDGCFTGTTGTS